MVRKVLLLGGVLSSLVYVIGIDVIAALQFPEYHDYADQMVSELFAARAPTRTLMVWLMIPYNVLVFGLSLGVWRSAEGQPCGPPDGCGDGCIRRCQHRGALVLSHGRARDRRIAARRLTHHRHDRHVDSYRGDDRAGGFRSWKAIPALLVCDDRHGRRVWRLGRLPGSPDASANTVAGAR